MIILVLRGFGNRLNNKTKGMVEWKGNIAINQKETCQGINVINQEGKVSSVNVHMKPKPKEQKALCKIKGGD